MLTTNYVIIGRYTDGVKVLGYRLVDAEGSIVDIRKEDVELMALNKQISNVSAQRCNKDGKTIIVMKGIGCKLKELPRINTERHKPKDVDKRSLIIGRISDGRVTYGYRVRTYNGEHIDISRKNIIDIARKGMVKNARVQRNGYKDLLRGVKCDLSKLPIVK